MSAVSSITLPPVWHFDKDTMRLLIRDFAWWAERTPSGGRTLAAKLEQQLCDGDGYLDEETYLHFSKWCHTGHAFQSAEHVAQAISLMVYGHIIERPGSTISIPRPRRS